VAFFEDIEELVSEMEGLVKNAASDILENCIQEVELYNKAAGIGGGLSRLEVATTGPWHIIEHKDAAAMVSDPQHKLPPLRNGDLGREHELWLCKHLGGVVAVVNWPAGIKPAYMREVEGSHGALVSAVDVLVPGVGELCGGSLREHCPQKLGKRLSWHGDKGLDWYLAMRSQGAAPTGGFGLGFERLVQYLVGVENIRDTIPFHRAPHSCPL